MIGDLEAMIGDFHAWIGDLEAFQVDGSPMDINKWRLASTDRQTRRLSRQSGV
jgi:hypothetical protein